MPVNPRQNEREEEFISRCIGEEVSAGYETEQAAAICYSYWRKDKMNKASGIEKIQEKLKFNRDFRGINLFADEGLEGACWEGYVAIGMKDLDGRMVPNCVPEGENMKEGVPHYTKDGELYTGPTHKDAEGRLMTGDTHTEDSEYLYHREDLEVQPMVDSSYPGEGAKTGSI